MKGLIYQLKSVRKDKFCIMSFLLPIVVAVALNFVGSIDLSSLGEFHFGVTAKATTSEVNTWLERYGTVTVYPTQEELIAAINEPSTNLIGVEMADGSIQTILSGDELDMFQQTANTLPALYEQREWAAQASVQVLERPDMMAGYQNIFIAITLIVAMFMGCTFNAMNIISEKEDEVRYRLVSNEETLHKYPFPFCLEIGYRIQGKKIEVMWEVKNTGDKEMYFQIGAHPAFYWPEFDASNSERGFFRFDKENGLKYILISEKGCADPSTEYSLELTDGLLPLDTHTFDKDALILENEQVRKVTLYNKEKQAYLSLHFNAPVVGLWSPPAKNAPFVCIEPWYGRCDRAHYTGEYKDKDWMQHLQPEEIFQGGYTIEIDE